MLSLTRSNPASLLHGNQAVVCTHKERHRLFTCVEAQGVQLVLETICMGQDSTHTGGELVCKITTNEQPARTSLPRKTLEQRAYQQIR